MNYFSHPTAAERYALGRPYFHPLVVEKIRKRLSLTGLLESALDVACGTGQSAVALAEIAKQVTATDISEEMLAQAPVNPAVRYVHAPAEALPFASEGFDLITVSMAFHWFDRARFLAEAHRSLKPGAYLVIYNNAFQGKMDRKPAFARWNWDCYVARHPTPARNNQPLTDNDALAHGFRFAHRDAYSNAVTFTAAQLTDYLMTQSNVIAAVEQGAETVDSVRSWLMSELAPFFTAPTGSFAFGGSIWYLQKA